MALPSIAADSTDARLFSGQIGSAEFHGYDRVFWLAYVANGLATLANAMMVRYADFVSLLGGEERQLGLIVGCGMVGSIAIRLIQGEAMDRYGAARIWNWSMALYSVSLLLHLTLTTAYGPAIFLTRILMQSSLAGVFGASITFMSLRVSPARMAEMIGALGTSGFLGIMLGPVISDWLSRDAIGKPELAQRLFWTAGGIAVLGAATTWLAARDSLPPRRRRRPFLMHVVTRYRPGMISVTAAAMGAGFSIPMTFLRPFAAELQISRVGIFFLVYASTAFAARVASRPHFQRFGNRPWILIGLSLLSLSYVCYLPISVGWHLAIPGAIAGAAHALLFPAIMAAGTSAFPRRYLGVATSYMLAMFDVGTFVGAPVVGAFIRAAKLRSMAAYPWMFGSVAVVLSFITITFYVSSSARAADSTSDEA